MRYRRIAIAGVIAAVMAFPSSAFASTLVADNDTDQSTDFGGQTGVIASNPDQTMVVDNSDSGDTTITQGPGDVTASTGDESGDSGDVTQTGTANIYAPIETDVDAPIATGTGPVASPVVVANQNDILSNNGNTYSQEQTTDNSIVQTQEDNSTRHNESAQTLVGRDFVGRDIITGGTVQKFGHLSGRDSVLLTKLTPRSVLLSGKRVSDSDVKFYAKSGDSLPLTGSDNTFSILFVGLAFLLVGCLMIAAGKAPNMEIPKISLGNRLRWQAQRAVAFATLMAPIR